MESLPWCINDFSNCVAVTDNVLYEQINQT